MTFETLNKIINKYNIPKNVRLMSDSGWECDATDMDGVFYNKDKNIIIFTQGLDDEVEGFIPCTTDDKVTYQVVFSTKDLNDECILIKLDKIDDQKAIKKAKRIIKNYMVNHSA